MARAGAADVDEAVAAAKHAFEQGEWSQYTVGDRRNLMHRFAEEIEKNKEELASIESTDNGKAIGMSMIDVATSLEILKYSAGYADKLTGCQLPFNDKRVSLAYTLKQPIGVCGQIVPWNFPLLMAIFKIAPVLTTGCTTVLKPAENTPLSALKLAELFMNAGGPPGVVNVLPGFGGEAGSAIVNHPDIKKIAFTGSTAVGKIIMSQASETLKPVGLELGGKAPMIICEDADLDKAINTAAFGSFLNTGQVCLAATRIFVHESIYDVFCERITQAA